VLFVATASELWANHFVLIVKLMQCAVSFVKCLFVDFQVFVSLVDTGDIANTFASGLQLKVCAQLVVVVHVLNNSFLSSPHPLSHSVDVKTLIYFVSR
jgi:hypothetical protein